LPREERHEEVRVHGIEDFATLMSCRDYRLESFGIPSTNKHTYVDRLRLRVEKGEYSIIHLSFLKPVGLGLVAGIITEPRLNVLLRTSGPIDNKLLDKADIPKPHLVWNIVTLDRNRALITWYAPEGMPFSDVRRWVEERGEWLGRGLKVPVHTCIARPREEDIPELARRFRELVSQPVLRLKAPIIAYILVALLDKFTLRPLKQIASLPMIAAARDLDEWLRHEGITERVRWKFIFRYYKQLSAHYVVGRYRLVYPTQIQRGIPLIVQGPPELAEDLYGVFSLLHGAHILVTDKRVIGTLRLPPEDAAQLVVHANRAGAEIRSYSRVYHFPLPFEYYDPIENRWKEERVDDIPAALRKLRYIINTA